MAIYRFKISFEDHEDVYRIIEIRASQTFKDFHEAIQTAIGFDNSKPASFFISDDYWRKGTEITLKDDTKEPDDLRNKPKRLMHKSKMADFIEDPHQKLLYLFDFDAQWHFNIELVKIVDVEVTAKYPRCVKSAGSAPKQYKLAITPPIDEDDEDDETDHRAEKIFHHEEMLGEGDDDDLEGEEGEETEEGDEGQDAEEDEPGPDAEEVE